MTIEAVIDHLTKYVPTIRRQDQASETSVFLNAHEVEVTVGSWKVSLNDDADEERAWEALSDEVFDSWEESLKKRQ